MAAFTGTKSINQGGHEYELGKTTGESKEPPKPSKNGGGGHGGIGGLLVGLAKAGKGAVDGVSKARNDVFNMASSGAAAGGVAVAGTLTNAGNEVNSLVSSINGIQQSMPTDKLTQDGLKTVLNAQNLGREASNWLTSTASLVKGLPDDMKEQVFDNIKDYAKEGGQLQKAESALEAFKDFPWESELPQSQIPSVTQNPTASATDRPSGTSMSTNTASQRSSEGQTTTTDPTSSLSQPSTESSSSTSSESASATLSPEEYIVLSREGTESRAFDDFVQKLDEGVGHLWSWKTTKTQMYVTNLTSKQAQELPQQHKFIKSVSLCGGQDEKYDGSIEEFRAVDQRAQPNLAREPDSAETLANASRTWKRAIVSDEAAPWWKRLISASERERGRSLDDLPYLADDSGGRGTTIYVLDDGFDLSLDDLAADGRTVETSFTPNVLTLKDILPENRLPEGIGGGPHGTM
ncbi:uncharacterized protein N0V89_010458 [Didymosphaeria variabile]|uniref:Peptidase S8/S53 domain-containing protein n=1 Tax=Didymosphaeria variabile TaxID=1932322 RepID=A0A9W8XC70_9PLEO|nr:uncharacterized protein N0V89_010458 [Didymosphaeria variabile]KAJ4346527.1 hypothetical protein N0V89_010458 [Didymosphaeria variabile]